MPVLNLAAAAILTAPVAGLAALAILIGGTTDSFADSNNPGLSAGSVCSTSGPLAGMSAAEAQNARVVAATASARAGDRAAPGVPGPSNNFSPVTGGNYLVQADKAARIVDLFSVSEGQAPPVPTIADWAWLGLRQGRTTVEIQRVTEPVPWSTTVAAGEIIDPGVSAREVTALATLHTTEVGIDMKTVTSVALNLNLEGSPALAHWGFVGVVTYDVVLVSRS